MTTCDIKVPATWAKRAWPSLRPLASWLADFTLRLTQLEEWQNNPMEVQYVGQSIENDAFSPRASALRCAQNHAQTQSASSTCRRCMRSEIVTIYPYTTADKLNHCNAVPPFAFQIPKVTWISGLVNPQSFLTAICQVSVSFLSSPNTASTDMFDRTRSST